MSGFFYGPAFFKAQGGGGSSSAVLAATVAFASPAGVSNNVTPGGGWPANLGRILVTLAGGNAEWTGLLAGTDGQLIQILNNDAVNQLQLDIQNAGSTATARFLGIGPRILPPGDNAFAVYWAGTVNRWVLL